MKAAWVLTVAALCAPVLIIALSVPMAMRRIPPNNFYGFRTAKTRSDRRIWYDANQKAGVNLIVAGCVTLAVWSVVRVAVGLDVANLAGITALLVAMLGSLAASLMQLRKM